MTGRFIDLDTGAVRETTDRSFYIAAFGHTPRVISKAEADAFREQRRREFEAETQAIRQRTAEMIEQMRARRDGDPMKRRVA